MPTESHMEKVAEFLGCSVDDLFTPQPLQFKPMMTLAAWAEREQIPLGRARNLFNLGILTGDNSGNLLGFVHQVPVAAKAPPDSKRLVRKLTQPLPDWVVGFRVNLDRLMRDRSIFSREIAELAGVTQFSVSRWRTGRGYPLPERLEKIAEALGVSVETLLAPVTEEQHAEWRNRYPHGQGEVQRAA
jgi:transcriptional regulator with XRE-family HTH domain